MTEPASTSVAVGCGGGGDGELGYGSGYRTPFTEIQLQELNHQAMIFKYLLAGLPVPPDLVVPIRRSFEALSARFFPHPSLGYCSYYGKKFDPEPGRCRRTDGKKWRCSKEAHPDSKYCERHMHRGRNRSRKPVESQSASHLSNNNSNNGSFQNIPMYSVPGSEGSAPFGINMTKNLHVEPTSYGTTSHNNEFRSTIHDHHALSPEASGSLVGGLRLSSDDTGSGTWRLAPSQDNIATCHDFDDMLSKQIHQQQQLSVHPFFSEWPVAKESWSSLDDGSNKNVFSSTQLSISIPSRSSDFSSRNGHSPNDS